MRMMILLSLVHQDDACWRPVSLLQVQRQRHHMITAGSNTAEVQTFQHDNIVGKQDEVRGMVAGPKAIDGKIVDSQVAIRAPRGIPPLPARCTQSPCGSARRSIVPSYPS